MRLGHVLRKLEQSLRLLVSMYSKSSLLSAKLFDLTHLVLLVNLGES